MTELQPIIDAVRQAATLCRTVQQTHIVRSDKAGHEPVTIADYGSQAIISRMISRVFPHDAVLAEEQGEQFLSLVEAPQREHIVALLSEILGESVTEADVVQWLDYGQGRDAARTWVIDPIDGTKGFLALRRYTIAVGLVVDGQPVAGVMGSPGYPSPDGMGKIFYAEDGRAYALLMSGGAASPIHVSTRTAIADIRIAESVEAAHKDDSAMARVYRAAGFADATIDRMDGQDKYAAVASGDVDLYLRLPRGGKSYDHKSWDHAAGVALVQAAGGQATDIDGRPLNFAAGRVMQGTMGMVISNGHIHQRVLDAIREAVGEEYNFSA
ncbi:MAG: 3'(2'),5'-bisphosphate nucleotidase [Chloroflexi bacterium]|nr:MAG: 3'(2'),5'-bisphosphate nucleotidase [Chloroflexota bacterium]